MITYFILAAFGLTAGMANAVMDHLTHHHSQGPWAKYGSNKLAFWGRPIYTWKRRYVVDSEPRRLKPLYRIPLLGWVALMFVDAWHTMQSIMWLSLFGAVAYMTVSTGDWRIAFAVIYASTLGTFTLFYPLLRNWPFR